MIRKETVLTAIKDMLSIIELACLILHTLSLQLIQDVRHGIGKIKFVLSAQIIGNSIRKEYASKLIVIVNISMTMENALNVTKDTKLIKEFV